VLVVTKDLVGRSRVPDRQSGAVQRNLVELVRKAASRPLAAQASEPVTNRSGDGLRLGLACQPGKRFG
jgi:hypothetical protein